MVVCPSVVSDPGGGGGGGQLSVADGGHLCVEKVQQVSDGWRLKCGFSGGQGVREYRLYQSSRVNLGYGLRMCWEGWVLSIWMGEC